MAKPCRYQLPGTDTWMSESEFKKALNDGLIDKFMTENNISVRGLKPKAVTTPVEAQPTVETPVEPVAETKAEPTQEAKPAETKTEPLAKEETPKYESKETPKKMVAPGRTKSAFDRNFTVEVSADGTTATVQGEPIETADGRTLTPPKETVKITTNINGERVAVTSKGDTVYLDRAKEVEEKQVETKGKTRAEIEKEHLQLAKESNGGYAIVYSRTEDPLVFKLNKVTGRWQELNSKGEWVNANDNRNDQANDAVNYTRKDKKEVTLDGEKFFFDFKNKAWKKYSEDGSLSSIPKSLAEKIQKQFVKENPNRAPKSKEEIKEVIGDIIDKAKFDTKNKAVSSLIPPNLWNKILDLVKEALLTGVDFTFAINDAAKKVFDKAVADGEITEQQAGEYMDEINNDKASRINGLSSVKNEFISETAKKIASIGMENIGVEEWINLAEQAIKNGEINPRDLVQSLIDNPRPVTPLEQSVLNYSKVKMLNDLDDLLRDIKDVDSDTEKSNINAKIKNIESDLLDHEVASTVSGSQQGLSFYLRQVMMDSQYNLFLPRIEKIYRDAGKEMPADLKREIQEAQKELRRLNREIERKRKESQEVQENEAVKNIKNSSSKKNSGKKITSKDGKISVSIDSIRKAVSDGAQTIEDVIEAVRSEVTTEYPNATDRQIRDAISNYGKEAGKTKTDLDKEIDRIRAVGRMISKLEDIQKQLVTKVGKIKNERNKRAVQKVLTDRERELKRAIREAMSDIPMTEDEIAEIAANNLEAYKNSLRNRNSELKRRIKDGDFSTQTKSRFQELDEEARQLELERQELVDKLEYEKTKAILQTQSDLKKLERYIFETLNLPKGLIASVDLSAPFRQGIIGMMTQSPKKSLNQLRQMVKFWRNPDVYDKWLSTIKSSEFYPLMKASGLHIAEQNGELVEMEEAFMSNLGNKIPIFGQSYSAKGVKVPGLNIYKRSDAAYTGFLNNMRVQMFMEGADLLKQQGHTMASNPKVFKDWAKFCNTATGRGNIQSQKEITKSAINLSAAFFSPRLIKARLEALGLSPGYYYSMDPASRAMALKTMATFVASTSLLIGAMALWYNHDDDDKTSVELDPRSSDFLKVRDGNTRVDLTGGMSIYHRTIYQFLRGQKKNTTTGEIKQLNKDFGGTTRKDIVDQFFANKLSPIYSKLYKWSSLTESEKLRRLKEEESKDVIFNRAGMPIWLQDLTVPLWMRDVEPIMKEQGYGAGAFLIGLSLLGEGVQYQEPRVGSSNNTISDFNDIQDFDTFEDPLNDMNNKFGF